MMAGVLAAQDGNAVGADDFAQGIANRLGQRTRQAVGAGLAVVTVADQMSQHLGVGGGTETCGRL